MRDKKFVYEGFHLIIGDAIPYVNASDLAIQSMASNKLITYAKAKALIDDTKEELSRYSGIYIVDKNKKFYRTYEWNTSNNSNASGVAVIDPSASFIIAPVEAVVAGYNSMPWGVNYVLIPNCTTSMSESDIINDYNGESNKSTACPLLT